MCVCVCVCVYSCVMCVRVPVVVGVSRDRYRMRGCVRLLTASSSRVWIHAEAREVVSEAEAVLSWCVRQRYSEWCVAV